MKDRYIKALKDRLAKEEGYIFKKNKYRYKVALVYPNTYKVGMANLGFQLVYYMLNSHEDIFCERVFLPDDKEAKPLSLETQTPLNEFDLILFSIQTEFDYINVIDILERSGLSPFKDKRNIPILAGGIAVSYNPAVLSPFIDGFFLGEAEAGAIGHLIEGMAYIRSKKEFLNFLSLHRNIYIPSLDEKGLKTVGRIENIHSPTHTHVFSEDVIFGDMFLLELSRGCEARCRFCIAGYFVKPFRPKPLHFVEEALKWGSQFRKKVGFIGADVSNYPWMEELKDIIKKMNLDTSFSSLRPFTEKRELIEIIKYSSQKTVTIAPECGTDRLRFLINKTHRNEEYIEFSKRLVKDAGVKHIKLYFLIGVPTETEEDLEAIVSLSDTIASIKGLHSVSLSINHVVPKPFTPFREYRISLEGVSSKIKEFSTILKRSRYKHKRRVELEKAENTILEYILSMGNEETGIKLYEIYEKYGKNVKKLIKEVSIDKLETSSLPVSSGIKEQYIKAHWNSMLKNKPAWGDCNDGCQVCGLCSEPYISSKTLSVLNSVRN